MPLTSLVTLLGALAMIASWAFIGQRIAASSRKVSPQVQFLRNFFLYMGIFFFIMFLPHALLSVRPEQFPIAMSWGYVIGHIFFYIALIQIIRLTFSMVPKLVGKEKYIVSFAIVVATLITIINIQTMPYGTLPSHNFEKHVTFFNAAPLVGTSIALFAALTVFPAAILLIINGVRVPERRRRSFLLGGGMFVLMAGGPIHDTAKDWQLYTLADVLTIIGILIITAGVLYRLEERIGAQASRRHRVPAQVS